MTAQPTSNPVIASSIMTSLSNFSASRTAARRLAAFSTLVMPKEEPALTGFTNSGRLRPETSSDSSSVDGSPEKLTDFGTSTPASEASL